MIQGFRIRKEKKERLKKEIVKAIYKIGAGANFSQACKNCGLSASEGYTWRTEDKKFNAKVTLALEETLEQTLDFCESKSMQLINGVKVKDARSGEVYLTLPSSTMIMYTTSRKGKHRGYVERLEQTAKDGAHLFFKPSITNDVNEESDNVSDKDIDKLRE